MQHSVSVTRRKNTYESNVLYVAEGYAVIAERGGNINGKEALSPKVGKGTET